MDLQKITDLVIELEADEIADVVRDALENDRENPFEILDALKKEWMKLVSYMKKKNII